MTLSAAFDKIMTKLGEPDDLPEVVHVLLKNAFFAGAMATFRFSTHHFRFGVDQTRFAALVESALDFMADETRGDPTVPDTLAHDVVCLTHDDPPRLARLRERVYYYGAISVVDLVTDDRDFFSRAKYESLMAEITDYVRWTVANARPPEPGDPDDSC